MTSRAHKRCRVHSVASSVRTTLLQTREGCCGHGDGACVIDSVIGSSQERWQHVKGLDRGHERQRGGSEEDLTSAQRLQGRLDDGMEALGKFLAGNLWNGLFIGESH
jgi:hypothetical protein